ncbi:MAG: type 11 methyltransferase [Verrucomicrobiales bacterium]|nr:type 11 methyltransferase [Verrucomicrobiales bacterium]
MKAPILEILQCPRCAGALSLTEFEVTRGEVRTGTLTCSANKEHGYQITDGIMFFASGFDHEAVKKEIAYENSTYHGSDSLTDAKIIAQFPDTLPDLWPHTCNFGPDFRTLIDKLNVKPGGWVLDVGTGPCWSTRILAERGYRAIALDVNDANFYGLRTADILFEAHNIYFERILESMTNLPFANETLDAITFNASFHHTPDMEKTLVECFRVLKPGGQIAMVNEEFVSLRQRLFKNETVSDTGSHHAIGYADFEDAVERNGFRIQYYVADHVRKKLEEKLSPSIGGLVVKTFELLPISLKQLNSALIFLTKPGTQSAPVPARSAEVVTT